ncbi:MAG: hypothetical protein HKO59_14030 [Phycisphaerales bacterium]|nr:hypothetical protein [Phycisphaerales bacterium]
MTTGGATKSIATAETASVPTPTPGFDPARGLLWLPPTAEAWDLQIDDGDKTVISVRPGTYRVAITPTHARRLRTTEFTPLATTVPDTAETDAPVPLPGPEGPPPLALVKPWTADGDYLEKEEILLQLLPNAPGFHEILIRRDDRTIVEHVVTGSNHRRLKRGLPVGGYTVRSRWRAATDEPTTPWTAWSRPRPLTVHSRDAEPQVQTLRIAAHRLAMMMDRDLAGVPTISDPWAVPPACPETGTVRWFRTPCFEGAGPLVNENADYYRDPLAYHRRCLASLRERGFVFRTWHDLLENPASEGEREVILQLDLDAGPRSLKRLCVALDEMNIRASLMVHRRCTGAYAYAIEDLDLEFLRDREARGWTIGYHNNALTEVVNAGVPAGEHAAAATRRFVEDVNDLRRWFDIRTVTHHGGNTLNRTVPVPPEAGVVGVDRAEHPALWATIDRCFSDGGFLSRPTPLADRVAAFDAGRSFIRNHPVKYGNYDPDFDVPPLVPEDITRVGGVVTDELRRVAADAIEHQTTWLADRRDRRLGQRITHATEVKPITRQLRPVAEIEPLVTKHWANRRTPYTRLAPWPWGDPRVYWWRLLDAFAPKHGTILNVGALPPARRDETLDFVGDATVLEVDIDPDREPHYLFDITVPPAPLEGTFDAVLLFGLTIIHSPCRAVEACHQLTRPGGVALFGFAADTHPVRGALWNPETRVLWDRGKEPLQNIGLKGQMWCFDDDSLPALFDDWDRWDGEFFGDMYYVVAHRKK